MLTINRIYFSFYDINIDKDKPLKLGIQENDITNYVDELLKDIYKRANRSRSYSIVSETTEVYSTVVKFLNEEIDENSAGDIIANRLHRAERNAQEKIAHFQNIKKGSIVQVLMHDSDKEEYYFIIAKVEDNNFLDKSTLIKSSGLPYEDSTFYLAP